MVILTYWYFSLALVWHNCFLSWSASDWRILIAWWGPSVVLGGLQPLEKHTGVHISYGTVSAVSKYRNGNSRLHLVLPTNTSSGGTMSWIVPVQPPAKGMLLLPWPFLIPLWSLGKAGMPQWHLKKQGELGPEHGTAAFPSQGQLRSQMLHPSCWKMVLVLGAFLDAVPLLQVV